MEDKDTHRDLYITTQGKKFKYIDPNGNGSACEIKTQTCDQIFQYQLSDANQTTACLIII